MYLYMYMYLYVYIHMYTYSVEAAKLVAVTIRRIVTAKGSQRRSGQTVCGNYLSDCYRKELAA